MATRKISLIVAACLGLAACSDRPSVTVASAPVAVPDAAGPRFSAGQVHRYTVHWTVDGTADNGMLGEAPLHGGLTLRGEIAMRVYPSEGTETLLGVTITALDEARVEVFGTNVLPDAETALMDRECVLVVPADGDARRLFFPPDSPSIYAHVMAGLLANVDLGVASSSAEWTRVARTGNGLAQVAYTRSGAALTRTVGRYLRLDAIPGMDADAPWAIDGQASIELDDRGVPSRIENVELVALTGAEQPLSYSAQTSFTLERTSLSEEPEVATPDLHAWTEHDLHEAPNDEEVQREMARKFAEGMTMAELATAVLSAGNGLRPSPGFHIRARGVLRGWPELAEELRPLYADAPDHRTREFILDVLVSADTPQAQAVALSVMDRDDPDFAGLLQHLSLLRDPVPDVGLLLLDTQAQARIDGDERLARASLYPMGAIASSLQATDPLLAERMVVAIRAELSAARQPEDIEAALAGLANAARPDDVVEALPFAVHPDIAVRAQVASSLRWSVDPAAVDVLFALLDDEDRYVAASALSVIDFYRDDERSLHRLATQVLQGEHHPELDGPLTGVLAKRGLDDSLAREALASLSERTTDPRQRIRIDRLLGKNRS